MTATSFDEAARDRPYVYSYARLVPHLTYDLYNNAACRVSVSLDLEIMAYVERASQRES
jgi:hypothetical protein